MRKFDSKHLVFHVLVALYFIWAAVFATLLGMALYNTYKLSDVQLTPLFNEWIFTNLIMGTALFIVIRLFRNRTLLDKVILYSFGSMAVAAFVVVFALT